MDKKMFDRQMEALENEEQREQDRHQRELLAIDRHKQSENDRHIKAMQNIRNRKQQLRNAKRVRSNEDLALSEIKRLNAKIESLCEDFEQETLLYPHVC